MYSGPRRWNSSRMATGRHGPRSSSRHLTRRGDRLPKRGDGAFASAGKKKHFLPLVLCHHLILNDPVISVAGEPNQDCHTKCNLLKGGRPFCNAGVAVAKATRQLSHRKSLGYPEKGIDPKWLKGKVAHGYVQKPYCETHNSHRWRIVNVLKQ